MENKVAVYKILKYKRNQISLEIFNIRNKNKRKHAKFIQRFFLIKIKYGENTKIMKIKFYIKIFDNKYVCFLD